jgi:hypothetical protein
MHYARRRAKSQAPPLKNAGLTRERLADPRQQRRVGPAHVNAVGLDRDARRTREDQPLHFGVERLLDKRRAAAALRAP